MNSEISGMLRSISKCSSAANRVSEALKAFRSPNEHFRIFQLHRLSEQVDMNIGKAESIVGKRLFARASRVIVLKEKPKIGLSVKSVPEHEGLAPAPASWLVSDVTLLSQTICIDRLPWIVNGVVRKEIHNFQCQCNFELDAWGTKK
ncbi:hypothetical protein CEXT_703821 [Caerostris extrusa]|uniref:Uncharacterized protein n=1 Tax=Caerostris extrusa TaxID=172846 RepID=A0AAV4P4I9_CAEEX|nr:hypothetical protein CEXT_703821 [Caerostris extrusa]